MSRSALTVSTLRSTEGSTWNRQGAEAILAAAVH